MTRLYTGWTPTKSRADLDQLWTAVGTLVRPGEVGVVNPTYPFGNVLRYGAVGLGLGVANALPAVQAAVDNVAIVGGGGVATVPPGRYKLLEGVGGVGIVLRDKVRLVGEHFLASVFEPSGVWTDSIVRGDFRDDNNANVEVNVGMFFLGVKMLTASAVRCLDLVGMRSSVFDSLKLDGNGTGITGQVAINLGEYNPSGSSRKSCYFNQISNIKGDGTGWGTWLRIDAHSNTSNNVLINHNSYSRIMVDASTCTQGSQNTFLRGYHLGDNHAASHSFKLPGGSADMQAHSFGVFVHWDWEFYTNQPAGSDATRSTRVDLPKAAEYARLEIHKNGYFSLGGTDSPLVPGDFSDRFVVSGYTLVNGAPGTVVLQAGTAYNRHRASKIGDGVHAVTNTGVIHTEYVVIDTTAELQRSAIRLAPLGTDLVLWEVTVSAAGLVTGQTDRRVFYANLQVRGLSSTATRAKNLRGITAPVAGAATFLDVTFAVAEADAQFGVYVSTRWNTTTWISNYSINGFRVNFGTAVPGGGSFIDWLIIR